MQTSRSSSSTILLIIILVFTAPIWLAVGGVLLGVVGGVVGGIFGAIFGVFGAIIGAIFAAIAIPFKIIFGSWDFFDGGIHLSGKEIFIICVIVLLVATLKRKQ